MWLLQKPRRGLYKPPGIPRIGRNVPRGLQLCLPLADPSGTAAFSLQGPLKPTVRGSSGVAGLTQYGQGLFFNGSTSTYINAYTVRNVSAPVSIEALVVLGAVGGSPTNLTFFGFNNITAGDSGTYEKSIGINGSGQFEAYVYDGGQQSAVDTTTTPTAGVLYHLVMTVDGSNLRLYVNGVQTASHAASGSFASYGTPYFNIGATQANASRTTTVNATFLLVNMAWAVWTPAEVMGRYLDPFGFLDYPDDDLFSEMSGLGTVRPRLIRMNFAA